LSTKEERRLALLQRFRDVAAERVQTIATSWVRLEETPEDTSPAQEMLRELHTLKGEAKAVGLPDLGTLAHRLETLLFTVREKNYRVLPQTGEVVLSAVDGLSSALMAAPGSATELLSQLLSKLDDATAAEEAGEAPAAAPAPAPDPSAPGSASPAPAQPAAEAQRAGAQPTGQGSLRVREERIASISAVTGELLVEQAKSTFAVARLGDWLNKLEQVGSSGSADGWQKLARELKTELASLDENTYRLGLHVRDLDRTVRELRLVPVGSALEPYIRMVRDLAHEQQKQASLKIEGGELEADKRVLEILEEPLLHLLRNCVDHGIEAPPERTARGKKVTGQIVLAVRPEGGGLQIVLSDDGRGLDPAVLRRKAVEKGLLSEAAAEALDSQQALELVFLSGFSTRDRATQLSGRGVGMDVVKRRVEQLGGRLAIGGTVGQGFQLTIRVPSSISMTRALVLPVMGGYFAVPCAAVERVVHLADTEIFSSHEGVAAEIEGRRIPVAAIAPLLGHGGDARGGRFGLLIRSGAERCLVTSEEGGREVDLVVKPLGAPLTRYRLLTGAAVLDSGELALVLDAGELLRMRRQGNSDGFTVKGRKKTRAGTRVLLVEDSVIFRTTVGGLLEGMGCEVQLAEDGMAGLTALESARPDLIVSDVQMPRMDGLEMIRRLRQDPRFAKVPVVILSSLGSAEDRQRGASAGANAYLIKGELNAENLGATLDRLLE
jgi:two-component system chemotaxis sensor kinase CheA/two-component system sensor histidine kinase and response regulator WspE